MKPIKISEKNWKKLIKLKYNYNYKSIDEIISKMFEIINKISTADKLLKEGKKNGNN